jgi:hypothetical protein
METAAAGEIKRRAGDDAACQFHRPLRLDQVVGPDDGKRRRRRFARVALDAGIDPGGLDGVVGRTVVDKTPAERLLEEMSALEPVARGEFQVPDLVSVWHFRSYVPDLF